MSFKPHVSTVRQMSDAEAAWVGAMVEGEGSINLNGSRKQTVTVVVMNTDLEVISTLLRFVGDGNVHLHTQMVNKPIWTWGMSGAYSIRDFAPQVIPWMTQKGDRLQELVASCNSLVIARIEA